MARARIAGGTTEPNKGWVEGPGESIRIHVDTSAAGFTDVPVYVCSLSGLKWHYATVGGNSVYSPDAEGFDVYLEWSRGATAATWTKKDNLIHRCKDSGWCIHWVGIQGI